MLRQNTNGGWKVGTCTIYGHGHVDPPTSRLFVRAEVRETSDEVARRLFRQSGLPQKRSLRKSSGHTAQGPRSLTISGLARIV